jgi:predicted unusual protein kinase regulating ubiquinone biosynthesis (AarF/ABC1/UbiB family)
MVGKIGFSLLGEKSLKLFMDDDTKDKRTNQNWIRNAERIVSTLGEMKGGVMKIGQMLSLQEGLLPREFTQILSLLQKEAPPVGYASLLKMVESDLPDYDKLFKNIDTKSYASASIGQVHKAELMDGTKVVLKIQYPEMEKVISSDLKNLKVLFGLLGKMMFKMDMDVIFREVRKQLMDEVDYNTELKYQKTFTDFFKSSPIVRIPVVYEKYSGKHVLCSEFLTGYDISEVCSSKFSDADRNLWGKNLYRIFLEQLFNFKYLHTDPNIANFAFLPEGKIIIYDFGNCKKIPDSISDGYKKMIRAFLDNKWEKIPAILKDIGICYHDGRLIEMEVVDAYAEAFKPVFYPKKEEHTRTYRFNKKDNLMAKLINVSRKYIFESFGLIFPPDIIFIDRCLGGLVGNLTRLEAETNWPALLDEYT